MITAYDHLDPHWLDRAAFSFRSQWWKAPQGTMHYIDEGEGAPVVFVHGVPGWSFHFRSLIRRVSAYRRCIAMDHLGFGLSEKPEGWHYDPAHLAANVEAMIDGLGLDLCVQGHRSSQDRNAKPFRIKAEDLLGHGGAEGIRVHRGRLVERGPRDRRPRLAWRTRDAS